LRISQEKNEGDWDSNLEENSNQSNIFNKIKGAIELLEENGVFQGTHINYLL